MTEKQKKLNIKTIFRFTQGAVVGSIVTVIIFYSMTYKEHERMHDLLEFGEDIEGLEKWALRNNGKAFWRVNPQMEYSSFGKVFLNVFESIFQFGISKYAYNFNVDEIDAFIDEAEGLEKLGLEYLRVKGRVQSWMERLYLQPLWNAWHAPRFTLELHAQGKDEARLQGILSKHIDGVKVLFLRLYEQAFLKAGQYKGKHQPHLLLKSLDPDVQSDWMVVASEYDFDKIYYATKEEVLEKIDNNRPNVAIVGISEDSLALARALDKYGDVNVFLKKRIVEGHLEGGDLALRPEALYHEGELLILTNWVGDPLLMNYLDEVVGVDMIATKKPLTIPTSGLPNEDQILDCKEVADSILVQHGLPRPKMLCWTPDYEVKKEGVTYEEAGQFQFGRMMERLREFMQETRWGEVVIKPVNGGGGRGVRFFKDYSSAARYVDSILRNGGTVIVEERLHSVPIYDGDIRKDWNLRVFVSRGQENEWVVDGMVVRIDDEHSGPVNLSLEAKPWTFDQAMEAAGIMGQERDDLRSEIERVAVSGATIIEEELLTYLTFIGHDGDMQHDFMGADIIVIQDEERAKKPVFLEINGSNSGGLWDLDSILPREKQGEGARNWVNTICRRAWAHYNKTNQ